MKNSLLVLAIPFLFGCAGQSFPKFPEEVKNHYVTDVHGEQMPPALIAAITDIQNIPATSEVVRCLKFDIISTNPYKIKYASEEPIKECNGVGGFKIKDSVLFFNWIQDILAWSEKHKSCFKL